CGMRLTFLLHAALLLFIECPRSVRAQGETPTLLRLEQDLLKGYNRKHRPVKSDTTALGVTILISITHIEKVNENEQTAVIHGTMFASWKDEYLTWTPSEYNGTTSTFLETWKIWQPALSLYNSARGNQWNLYMGGAPASIDNKGVVMSQGAFSFYVTCQFDFSNWPNDEHRCPIVIADWVYDLSRVNLSESINNVDMKPYLNLHYDPFDNREKKHVAGWEIVSTTRKHCYWGRKWCQDEVNVGPGSDDKYEYYWSVLEFGVIIRRHAPYVLYTLVLPTILSSFLTLFSFWIDHEYYPLMLLVFNSIFQALYGWDMVRTLPSGNGAMPDMIWFYGVNLSLTLTAIVIHILVEVLPVNIPKEIELPEQLRVWAAQIRSIQFFSHKGFSFDPAELYGNGSSLSHEDPSTPSISTLNPSASAILLSGFETTPETGEVLVQMEECLSSEKPCSSSSLVDHNDEAPLVEVQQDGVAVEIEGEEEGGEKKDESILPPATAEEHFALVRRIAFCLFALIYLWELPFAFN
ncbi:lgc-25, partial [Pristionchus pacificus]